jgi:branched-chain amino acid transport system permease protein
MTTLVGVIDIGCVRLPYVSFLGLAISVALIIGLSLFLDRTTWGRSLMASNHNASSLDEKVKRQRRRTNMIIFGVGTAMAGAAGTILGASEPFTSQTGLAWSIKAAFVMMIAGAGNIKGSLYAGLLLGVVESISVYFTGAPYREAVGLFLMLLLMIVFGPQGLFTKNTTAPEEMDGGVVHEPDR